MKVLIVEPGYSPYEADIENTPTALTAILESEQYTAAFPFDNTVISTAFGLDLNAYYNGLETTYGDVIHSRALALKKTLYGTAGNGSTVPLTDVELIAFLARQNCSETRKHVVKTGLSLVGKVPYFWGGKSAAGWNHVLIFAGYGENGERMWVHSSGGEGVIFNTPSYEAGLALRRPKNVDFGDTPG